MDMSAQTSLSPEEKQNQALEMRKSCLYEPKANLHGRERLLLLLIPPPPNFVNCQITSAFTFPWVNLGLIITPPPVTRPMVRFTQVRHQMAHRFAKHKCYKTANSMMSVML